MLFLALTLNFLHHVLIMLLLAVTSSCSICSHGRLLFCAYVSAARYTFYYYLHRGMILIYGLTFARWKITGKYVYHLGE